MAENLSFYDKIRKEFHLTETDTRQYSPIVLAYIGDSVLELIVRTIVTNKYNTKVSKINHICSDLVKATTQSKMIRYLLDNDCLSPEEKSVYKRGRNANSLTTAKHASISEYKMSTGFEALLGFLYLNNRVNRILNLVNMGIEYINNTKRENE